MVKFYPVIKKTNAGETFGYHADKNPNYHFCGSATVKLPGIQLNGVKLKRKVLEDGNTKFFLQMPTSNGVPVFHRTKDAAGEQMYNHLLEAVVAAAKAVWEAGVDEYRAEKAQIVNEDVPLL